MISHLHKLPAPPKKKSLKNIINKIKQNSASVYILSNSKKEMVVIGMDSYEKLLSELDELEEKIFDIEVIKRLSKENRDFHCDYEVRGEIANQRPVIDENDGWH
ncbi:MAG: hypothetical protein ABF631_05750 [Liquorilactobacillus nagelii]|uniref:hypothetical protein n=2 Tax=Liquorilactobacillus nagelii TaxID=82688 RepID=UPI0039E9ADAF